MLQFGIRLPPELKTSVPACVAIRYSNFARFGKQLRVEPNWNAEIRYSNFARFEKQELELLEFGIHVLADLENKDLALSQTRFGNVGIRYLTFGILEK
jgi:hypothetical protein